MERKKQGDMEIKNMVQCEHLSYKFGIYICELRKEEKKIDCHECSKFLQSHLWSRK